MVLAARSTRSTSTGDKSVGSTLSLPDPWNMHAYLFSYPRDPDGGVHGRPYFERTFPVPCIDDAFKWLSDRGKRGYVSVNCLPQHYWR